VGANRTHVCRRHVRFADAGTSSVMSPPAELARAISLEHRSAPPLRIPNPHNIRALPLVFWIMHGMALKSMNRGRLTAPNPLSCNLSRDSALSLHRDS
jgi:hypothetical protein